MFDKEIEGVYKEAKRCAEIHKSSNFIKCIKNKLEIEIGDDKNILLAYKISCSNNTNTGIVSSAISFASIVISAAGIICDYAPDNLKILGEPLWIYLMIILLGSLVIWSNRVIQRNREILMILEEIEKEMEHK